MIFAGTDEVITFKPNRIFQGNLRKKALQAALFLAGKEPGLYDMQGCDRLGSWHKGIFPEKPAENLI